MPAKCEVFISYAGSDGRDFAAWLRERIQNECPDISLWQDIISERAGRDWWLQITEALGRVAHMVLLATPGAMRSEMVRKEWRFARQQGVCVLPVQASDVLDLDSLPRWMKTKHFANLQIGAQWEVFVADLRSPCETPRVPFMAADLPADFVNRPEEFENIIKLLLDEKHERVNPVAITTALRGAGGFGKTTLAKAICHDQRVQEVFDDGILWVTLGEQVDNLPGRVAELTSTLGGAQSSFGSLDSAVARLRELLADRDILMVIDDVWDPIHLEPFMQGGPHCTRLITTRNSSVLPQQCRDVKVDSMHLDEAVEFLGAGLPPACKPQIRVLADRMGSWPLLLGIVKGVLQDRVRTAKQPTLDAIAFVNRAFDKRGLTAFDPGNAQARNRAVAQTVSVGLEHFSRDPREQQRFEELSIFPEDVEIPLSVVATLWHATGGLDEFDVEDLCARLHRWSLVHTLDLETRHIRLHDVMRSYLQNALLKHTPPDHVHGKMLDAWGDPQHLPEPYAWQWYAYHLTGAGRQAELRQLLLSPTWLQTKLTKTDVTSLSVDFDYLRHEKDTQLVQGAIRLSSSVIATDPEQFVSQMVGRLLLYRDLPTIDKWLERVERTARTPWLRLLQPTLHPPGTPVVQVLTGHNWFVKAVAVTRDRRRAVSGSEDNTLKVWHLASGHALHTLTGHAASITAVALTSNDRHLVSASEDRTLKVWDLDSGRELFAIVSDEHFAAVAVTPNGARILAQTYSGTLKEWDLATGRELRTLSGTGPSGLAMAVAVTSDGQQAITASPDTLKVWELASGKELRMIKSDDDFIRSAAIPADGRLCVTASEDGTVKVWDLAAGRKLRTLTGHSGSVFAVAVTPDGQRAVSASEDRTVKVWDLGSGSELRTLRGHSGWVYAVAVTADGHRAVSGAGDQTLIEWDLESAHDLSALNAHEGCVFAVAVTPDERRAVSASDRALKVWDLASRRVVLTIKAHNDYIRSVAITADGRQCISASDDRSLKVWDLVTGHELQNLGGHEQGINAVALTPDGKQAISGSTDRTLQVWEWASGRELHTLVGHTDIVNAVAVTPDGQRVISASADQTLKVWDLARGRELRTLTGHSSWVSAVAVTPDGRRAVSASDTLKVWDLFSGREVRTLAGHTDHVNAVAIARDGRRAASASEDRTVRVWDMDTGECVATFVCDVRPWSCAFSNAFDLIIAGDSGGNVHFLQLEEPKSRS